MMKKDDAIKRLKEMRALFHIKLSVIVNQRMSLQSKNGIQETIDALNIAIKAIKQEEKIIELLDFYRVLLKRVNEREEEQYLGVAKVLEVVVGDLEKLIDSEG